LARCFIIVDWDEKKSRHTGCSPTNFVGWFTSSGANAYWNVLLYLVETGCESVPVGVPKSDGAVADGVQEQVLEREKHRDQQTR